MAAKKGFTDDILTAIRTGKMLTIRAEIYNMFNQVRFGPPTLDRISAANFGKFTSQANTPRQMQLALRYNF